jgi:hypothetical protein
LPLLCIQPSYFGTSLISVISQTTETVQRNIAILLATSATVTEL